MEEAICDLPPVQRTHGKLVQKLAPMGAEEKFHFVLSNKTESDAFCIKLHKDLTERGLRVWQQTKNIPKDSANWFSIWYPCAIQARKIICVLTADYMKSEFCMKEWRVAEAKGKLLVIALEGMDKLTAVNPAEYPHASNALAYLDGGGQVIFHDKDDVIGEILKFTDQPNATVVH